MDRMEIMRGKQVRLQAEIDELLREQKRLAGIKDAVDELVENEVGREVKREVLRVLDREKEAERILERIRIARAIRKMCPSGPDAELAASCMPLDAIADSIERGDL